MDGDDEGEQSDDPFERSFDDDFVRAASKHEQSAAARAKDIARAQEAYDELAGRRRDNRRARRPHRRLLRRLGRRRSYVPLVLMVTVLGAAIWNGRTRTAGTAAAPWVSGPRVVGTVDDSRVPTPPSGVSKVPLGRPPALSRTGPYVFSATQPGNGEPVAYDPCRPIAVVVNRRTAPDDADAILAEALSEVSVATGLQFRVEGPTDEGPGNRAAFQPDRYGDRWAPVLVAWSDPAETPELGGTVAGLGGSTSIRKGGLPAVYVSGRIALDGPQLSATLERRKGRNQVRSVLMHELGHVVGLDHVADPDQLMNAEGRPGVVDYQAGDRTGLARLGQGACVPEL